MLGGAVSLVLAAALVHCGSDTGPTPPGSEPTSGSGGITSSAGGSGTTGGGQGGGDAGTGGATSGSAGDSGSAGSAGSNVTSGAGGSAGSSGSGGAGGSGMGGSSGAAGSGGSGGGGGSGFGCIGGTCLNPNCTPFKTAAPIDRYPGTGFDEKPSYIPPDVIIPTLDDVPDSIISPPIQAKGGGNWTTADLAYLDAHNMHWDFFINTKNACNLTGTVPPAECTAAVMDVLKLHYPGNHTVHHWHLGTQGTDGCGDATCVRNELAGVESFINTASKSARPHLTRFRAPFGEPYQDNSPGIAFVAPAAAQFAVAVGWNLDSDDSNHDDGRNCTGACPTGQSIAATVEKLIKTPGTGSAYGIVLMHGIFGWTRDAIPLLFDPNTGYLAKNKFRVGTVEDAICWKYGKHSWEIVQMLSGQARSPN